MGLGRIALLTGDHEQAAELHERARDLTAGHGDRPGRELAEVRLGLLARRQGRLDDAEAYLSAWLEWNLRLDSAHGTALILAELGFIAELRGDAPTALTTHRRGFSAARRRGDPRAVALALEGLAGALAPAGHYRSADRLLTAATGAGTGTVPAAPGRAGGRRPDIGGDRQGPRGADLPAAAVNSGD